MILLSSALISFDASRLSFSSNENAVAIVSNVMLIGGIGSFERYVASRSISSTSSAAVGIK